MSDDLSIPSPAYRPPRRERQGWSEETKRRMMIAGGLAGALVLVVGGVSLIGGRRGGEVPVVQADERPVKVKPDNPGGLQIAGVNNDLFGDGADQTTARLAPATEAPNPAGLRAQQAQSPAQSPAQTQATPQATDSAPPQAPPAPVARTTKPDTAKPAVAAPVKPDTAKPAAVAPVKPDTAKPAAAAPAAPAVTPQARPAGSGRVSVQLAAVASEDGAKAEWRTLAKRMPDLLGSHQPSFVKAERDGKTFWRIRTSGFADVADARGFCDRVRAKGAACTVAEF